MTSRLRPWVAPVLFFLVLALTQSPHLNPDALEMAQVGASFFGESAHPLSWTHYPPLYPFFAGLFSLVLHTPAALVAINLFCILGLVLLLQHWVSEKESPLWQGLVVLLVGLGLGPVRDIALAADPRALQLLLIFLGLFLIRPEASGFQQKLLGVLAGLVILCRPEGLLFSALLLGGATVVWRRAAWRSAVFFCGIVLPYFVWIFRATGSLSTRSWELQGAGLLTDLPVRPLVQMWGAGASDTPFREILQGVEGAAILPSSSLFSALFEALRAMGQGVSPLWLLLAGWGAGLVWRRSRIQLLLFLGVFLGALALYWAPMGRDEAQPLVNLLPAVAVVWVLASVGAVGLVQWKHARLKVPFWGVLLVLAPISAREVLSSSPNPDLSAQASAWLKNSLSPQSRIASSLGSSEIVRRAKLQWERVPARWERPHLWSEALEPDYLLLSSVDGVWMLGPPFFPEEMPLVPVAYLGEANDWVLVLDLKASRRQMHQAALDAKALHQGDVLKQTPGGLE